MARLQLPNLADPPPSDPSCSPFLLLGVPTVITSSGVHWCGGPSGSYIPYILPLYGPCSVHLFLSLLPWPIHSRPPLFPFLFAYTPSWMQSCSFGIRHYPSRVGWALRPCPVVVEGCGRWSWGGQHPVTRVVCKSLLPL